MANLISKKLKYINKNGEEKEINLYDDFTSFSDYDNGNYIAVQTDEGIGYIYCNSELPEDNTNHFASFIDKNNILRYAYTEEKFISTLTYTFTTGYDVMPNINGVAYSSKYEDKINGDGTTTRTLLSDELITQISFYKGTNKKYLLSFDKFSNIKLTTCNKMFSGCSGLKSVNLSSIDTSNVTDMYYMFETCSSLTSLDVSNFDTSKVTNIYGMFYNCKNLTSLNLSNWHTSKVTSMEYMFYGCQNLTSLNLSNWNTSKVTRMNSMFLGCTKLTSLDVSNFDTSNVTGIYGVFYNCQNLTSLNLSNWNTSKITSMGYAFGGCSSLTSLDIRNFSSIKLTNCTNMLSSINSDCKVYVNKSKFTKTESECGFSGSFTYVTS